MVLIVWMKSSLRILFSVAVMGILTVLTLYNFKVLLQEMFPSKHALMLEWRHTFRTVNILEDQIAYDRHGGIIFRKDAILKSRFRKQKAKLIIGISTVRRKKKESQKSYLNQTLHSLLDPLSRKELDSILIILLMADVNEDERTKLAREIDQRFINYTESGIIQLIKIPERYYPRLQISSTTFNDSVERVKWRAKQALDFSFLFDYSYGLSEYYMHMEDDVIAHKSYLTSIFTDLQILKQKREQWLMLDYLMGGFIGKVTRNSFLPTFSGFLRAFHKEMPCDIMLKYLNFIAHENWRRPRRLFYHIGSISSSLGT